MMSKRKGRNGEREAVELLREHGFSARRGVQYAGGPDSPDIVHDIPGVHFEVKRTETFRLYSALEQAKTDRKDGDVACVLHRQNGREWVAVMPASDLLTILRALYRRPA